MKDINAEMNTLNTMVVDLEGIYPTNPPSKSIRDISFVRETYRLSPDEFNELVRLGDFVLEGVNKKVTSESLANFSDRLVAHNGIQIFKSKINPRNEERIDELLREIGRIDSTYANGIGLIPIKNGRENIHYSRAQLNEKLEQIKEIVYRARLGINLLETYKKSKKAPLPEDELRLDSVLRKLGLEQTSRNKKRVIGYGKHELGLEDKGIISTIIKNSTPHADKIPHIRRFLEEMYKTFYSADPEYDDVRRIRDKKYPMIRNGIDYVVTEENLMRFIDLLSSQSEVANSIFPNAKRYFTLKLKDNIPLAELIAKEAARYSLTKIDLLEPMRIEGELKYHPSDGSDFIERLNAAKVFNFISHGIWMQDALIGYIGSKKNNYEGLKDIKEVAEDLKTTEEKAQILRLNWQDRGFLYEFMESMQSEDIKTKELTTFIYENFLKGKDPDFSDDRIVRYMASQEDLEAFKRGNFPDTIVDILEANAELDRQYAVDKKTGFLFDKKLAAFTIDGKRVNADESNNEITGILASHPETRTRLRWSAKLKEFYSNIESNQEYTSLDKVLDEIGAQDKDRMDIKKHIGITRPAVIVLHGEKGFITPEEFDRRYFSGYKKEFVSGKSLDKFKEKMITKESVAKAFTGIDISYEEFEKAFCVHGKTIQFREYNLKLGEKEGNYYCLTEITDIQRRNPEIVKNIQLALAIPDLIDKVSKEEKKYVSINEASDSLGVSRESISRYIRNGSITLTDRGLAPLVKAELEKQYNLTFTEEQIIRFCQNNGYKEVRKEEGVSNLDSFIASSVTYSEAMTQVSGSGWLAQKVFKHCAQKVNEGQNIYVTIDGQVSIHERDVEAIENYQKKSLSLDVIREAIAQELGVERVNNVYPQLNGISRSTDRSQIEAITKRVEEFRSQCYSRERIKKEFGLSFSDDSALEKIICSINPNSQAFLGNSYYVSDIEKIKGIADATAKKLVVSPQTVIGLLEKGLIKANPVGITDSEIAKLSSFSYTLEEVFDMSKLVVTAPEVKQWTYSYNGKKYIPSEIIAQYVQNHVVSGLSEKSITQLVHSERWYGYLKNELNGTFNQKDERDKATARIIRYIADDLVIRPQNGKYSTEDFTRIMTFLDIIQERGIHRLTKFRPMPISGEYGIDPDTSFYTRTEVLKLTRLSASELDKTCEKIGVRYLGADLSKDDLNHNDVGLYSVRDVSRVMKEVGHSELKSLTDPMETVVMYGVLKACDILNVQRTADDFTKAIGKDMMEQLGQKLKIPLETINVQNSLLYQKIVSGFDNITVKQYVMRN